MSSASPAPLSFADLVREHWTVVFRCMMHLAGNVHDAEELTQETFLRAMPHWPTSDETRPRAWLLRIARNAWLDLARRRTAVKFDPLPVDHSVEENDPGRALTLADEAAKVRAALAELSELARTVFLMRVEGELSFAEIAAAPGFERGSLPLAHARGTPQADRTFERGMPMTCNDIRDEILSAEKPSAAASQHLESCSACRELAAKLLAVEAAVRAVPTPPEAATSQAAFLQSLSPTIPTPRRRRVAAALTWVTAAAVLLAVGISAIVFAPSRQVEAKSQVVDELVEWNLRLSEIDKQSERERLQQLRLPEFQNAVRQAKLPPREQDLANQLLDHSAWLARNDDPLDAADRFQDLSDTVLTMMEDSTSQPRETEQYAVYISKLNDRGVSANMARAAKRPAADAAKAQRVARKQQRHEAKLEALAARLTDAAREKVMAKKKNGKNGKHATP